jgi:maleate isomerase
VSFEIRRAEFDDGPARLGRIGLLALANDIVIEGEIRRMADGLDLGLYAARVAMPHFGTVEALHSLREQIAAPVARLVPRNKLDVIAFGCTSAAAIIGEGEITRLIQEARGQDVPCTNPVAAAVRCLAAQHARRIALLSPYPEPVCRATVNFLRSCGFECVRILSFDTVGDENISRISPRAIAAAATELAAEDCDALFISCTALRVVDLIQDLEAATGRLIVTSNQALLADALRIAGSPRFPSGFGRILAPGRSNASR